MLFKDFNDLVGTNKPWGPVKYLLPWQFSLYTRAKNMISRCYNPNDNRYSTYGGSGIKCQFVSFSQYYYVLTKDPLWSNFVKHPELYHIDKDIKCGHGVDYAPNTVSIVLAADNDRECMARVKPRRKGRKVCLDGVVYEGPTAASIATGIPQTSISLHANGSTTGHCSNSSNTWTDRNGIQHTAYYI